MESAQAVYDEAAAGGWSECDNDARRMLEGIRFALRCYRRYSQGAGETKKSIIISLGVRLSPLGIREVREILADDTIRIDELTHGKSAASARPSCSAETPPDNRENKKNACNCLNPKKIHD